MKQKAAAKAAEAHKQFDAAKADATAKLDAPKAAQEAAKAAEAKKAETAKAAREAKLALEPVSIFISRKTQKLYVRRDTHKRFPDGGEIFDSTIEIPVTIRDPDKAIGTHIITAMARTDAGLRWSVVTIDGAVSANDALDRITIPQEVLDRIAPTAQARSSIVISDEGLHSETNYRTEFIVVLNDHPQGGIANRARTEVRVARRDEADDQGWFGDNRRRDSDRRDTWGDNSWQQPQQPYQPYQPYRNNQYDNRQQSTW